MTGRPPLEGAEIKALERDVARLETELETAKDRLHEARCKAIGIAVGDVVYYRGKEHRVTHVDQFGYDGRPWVRAVVKKKNGDWGGRPKHLYTSWTKLND